MPSININHSKTIENYRKINCWHNERGKRSFGAIREFDEMFIGHFCVRLKGAHYRIKLNNKHNKRHQNPTTILNLIAVTIVKFDKQMTSQTVVDLYCANETLTQSAS